MLSKGDVALSVTLTAVSSILTLFTLPIIMELTSRIVSHHAGISIELPVGKLLMQNIVLLFVPLVAGWLFKLWKPAWAARVSKVLNKLAFPALMTLALLFFLQYTQEIIDNFRLICLALWDGITNSLALGENFGIWLPIWCCPLPPWWWFL